MEFFRIRKDIPFMRHALGFNVVSLVTFLAAVFFLIHNGLHLSVEFTGGTVLEVNYPQVARVEPIRDALSKVGYPDAQVQTFGTSRDVLIRLPLKGALSSAQQSDQVMGVLTAQDPTVKLQRVEFVGPQVGKELVTDGLLALLSVVVGIVIYLSFRFEWKYAVAGIIANLHDVVIILGFFAFFQWEFSLSVLAAVLAVLGYSVNESVVIFDRIRETFRRQRKMSVTVKVINHGITSTDLAHHQYRTACRQNGGAVDVPVRRPDAALLCAGAHDRDFVRYLLVGIRRRGTRHVAGRETRRPDQADQTQARSERSERWSGGLAR